MGWQILHDFQSSESFALFSNELQRLVSSIEYFMKMLVE